MKNILGDPVKGDNFFGREGSVRLLWHKLERQSLIVSAPRRVGKTSLMYRLRDDPHDGWTVVHFNAESCRSVAHFVATMLAAIRGKVDKRWWKRLNAWARLKGAFSRIKKIDTKLLALELESEIEAGDWRKPASEVLTRLADRAGQTLILIDEFPYFLQTLARDAGRDAVEEFLHWFRGARQELARGGKVRFVVYGSVGLDSVLRRLRLSGAVNDLDVVSLGPFDEPTAHQFLELLGVGEELGLDEATIERILERLGGWYIPFHLQLVFSRLHDSNLTTGAEPSPDLVDRAYEELLSPSSRKYFSHWDERLDDALDPEEARDARRLLTAAAVDPRGITRDTVAALDLPTIEAGDSDYLVDLVLHDGYLVRDGERLRFASPLLRDWWTRWHPEV